MSDNELMAIVMIVFFSVLYFMVIVTNYRTLERANRALRLSDMTPEARALMRDAGYDV